MNLEEAGPLFRELYYRGKVTLETAQKVRGIHLAAARLNLVDPSSP